MPKTVKSRSAAARKSPAKNSATQSLDRALALLDTVVDHAAEGLALPSIVTLSGLSKPTAHRLMNGLRQAALVDYDPLTRRFSPSFKLYRMGLAAGARFNIVEAAAAAMDRLAQQTGDTVYLSVRSGDQSVCVARRVGSFPIKTLTLEVGDARPLGLGAGSLALLAATEGEEFEAILSRNRETLEQHVHHSTDEVRRYCQQTRRDGYSTNDGIMMPEMAAVGMVVRDARGTVCAALSVAAIRSRIQPPRRTEVIQLLRAEVATIEKVLSGKNAIA